MGWIFPLKRLRVLPTFLLFVYVQQVTYETYSVWETLWMTVQHYSVRQCGKSRESVCKDSKAHIVDTSMYKLISSTLYLWDVSRRSLKNSPLERKGVKEVKTRRQIHTSGVDRGRKSGCDDEISVWWRVWRGNLLWREKS